MIPLKGFQFIGKEELLGAALNHARSFALVEMCLCRKFLLTLHPVCLATKLHTTQLWGRRHECKEAWFVHSLISRLLVKVRTDVGKLRHMKLQLSSADVVN